MSVIAELLHSMPAVARVVLLLSLVAAAGLGLGQVKVRGVGLGIGGVLFSGIAGGHLARLAGIGFDAEMMDFIRDFGLVLFVYTIGIQVGPGFFSSLRRSGLALNGLALLMVLTGVAVAVALHLAAGVPLVAALGLLSGAVTNAPALAASQQVLKEIHAGAADLAVPGLAFAVTYPFGIAGNLLAMSLLRFGFRIDPIAEAAALEAKRRAAAKPLETLDLVVFDPALDGKRLRDLDLAKRVGVVASRLLRDGRLRVPRDGEVLRAGDVLHLVGPRPALEQARLLFGGVVAERPLTTKGTDLHWERLVVTSSAALGRSVGQLGLKSVWDVSVSRISRAGIELVPSETLALHFGDILPVIGHSDDVAGVADILGNSERRLQQVELVPVFLGIALGAVIGSIPLFLPGMPAPLRLGLAGGPLLVALALARLGNLGPLVWFMPPAANLALREIGIVLFLAVLGLGAGGSFVDTVTSGVGLPWMAYGALVTMVPLLVAGLVGRLVLKLDLFTLCGVLAGAQTNPPGLAYANAFGQPEAPSLAYATVYPLVMCLRILAPQVMVLLLWR
jgi:putative transport protein